MSNCIHRVMNVSNVYLFASEKSCVYDIVGNPRLITRNQPWVFDIIEVLFSFTDKQFRNVFRLIRK